MAAPRKLFFSSEVRAREAIANAAAEVERLRSQSQQQTPKTTTTTAPAPMLGSHKVELPVKTTTAPEPAASPAPLMLGNHKVEVPKKAHSTTYMAPPPPPTNFLAPLVLPTLARNVTALGPPATPSLDTPAGVQAMLTQWVEQYPDDWHLLVGMYFQHSGRSPLQVGDQTTGELTKGWIPDGWKADKIAKDPSIDLGQWQHPQGQPWEKRFTDLTIFLSGALTPVFESVIRHWAVKHPDKVAFVLHKAGWKDDWTDRPTQWYEVDEAMKMRDGPERDEKLAQLKQEWPHFFQQCVEDVFCGIRRATKRKTREDEVDSDYDYQDQYEVHSTRILGTLKHGGWLPRTPPKRFKSYKYDKMSAKFGGRPTQFHGVPLEERAIDSNGNRLPFALVYPDDHPKARGQKRHVEETGPFGKSTRRKGSSRLRSTVTPARKESTNLDGWEKACQTSAKWEADALQERASTTIQNDGNVASHLVPSYNKEPTQILLFGYQKSREYQAIDLFEKISQGIICEDYPRGPPAMFHKYPTSFSSDRHVHPRKLTPQEKKLASVYGGGESWVKLTCESAEAAARAVENSGQQVLGHWVYAELWNGQGPSVDEPIPIREEDRVGEGLGSARPPRRTSQSLSAAFSQHASKQQRAAATLPRSFNPNAASQIDDQQRNEATSASPSTASSATATGSENYSSYHRQPYSMEGNRRSPSTPSTVPAPVVAQGQYNPAMMRHFQDRPRTVLRPASEAFLPMPTRWERNVTWLRETGWIPGDFIGDALPITATGEFDWAAASWYWRLCYWIDTHIGTDICGLKDN
ncbi:hypothetical protein P7C71_g3148, partial [Lecanoromycetidae sp. Uapishka_2]